jgi:RHS repeat-associated protein
MVRLFRCLYASVLFALAVGSASAQVPTGTPQFGSFGEGPDIINLANLNAHIRVPVRHKSGRGTDFTYDLSYDTSVWYPVGSTGSQSWQPVYNWGWRAQTEVATGYASFKMVGITDCSSGGHKTGSETNYSNWIYHDPFGIQHPVAGTTQVLSGTCSNYTPGFVNTTQDGSGITMHAIGNTFASVTTTAGKVSTIPLLSGIGAASAVDRNGNEFTVDASGNFTDTLGTTALAVTGTAPSPTTFTYTAPSTASASYTMKYTSYTVQTSFGCSGISEYGPTINNLVTEIDLPDTTKYTFTYQTTPNDTHVPHYVTGRLASVTLPDGGTISYTYTGGSTGNITCADGSTPGLTRTTPDGTWTYTRAAGTGAAYTTTVVDPERDTLAPSGNQTVIQFQGIYETQRQFNQGASTLLLTTNTCYNAASSPCTGAAISLPISQVDVYSQLPGTSNLLAKHTSKYNSTYGMVTELDDYDYGSGAAGSLLQKTAITYASLVNNLVAFPHLVIVTNGGGNTISQTQYNYDETAVVTTSGTPQHTAISGSRGNLTSVNSYTAGATFLTSSSTYFDTGTVQTAKDVNGAQTTNTYGTGSCGNSFPTSVSEPLGLSRSAAWNCNGGAPTSVTDENGKITTVGFLNAYFWRPDNVLDPTSAQTNFTYTGQNSVESILNFNSGASTSGSLTTLDGLGRASLSQVKQGPSGNFDTVEQDYDSLGRPSRNTLPYSGSAGQTNSTGPATMTTYDALGRPLSITDAGGGTTTYSYNQNDVLVTVGPAAVGENTKRRQLQYDSLGRLTSVCEISGATGSGTCGQTAAQPGFWTTYAYNTSTSGPSLSVTQNATGSQQTRSYVYDLLGRLTSETNPENGTVSYKYDSATVGGCSVTDMGDLVIKTAASGISTCYVYDALHRVLSIGHNPAQANGTPDKFFGYDSATINGLAMTNTKGRLAEAYTCLTPCTKITDIGFSYTARGEISDAYQWSTNSAGYYHENQTYYENGVTKQISGLASLPTFTYGVDGEGRVNSISASTGQNPLTATTYNSASLPTAVTFGSLDNDAFTYDPNTFRLTKYQFNVNSQPYSGVLTWNANGSLNGLNITDPFNSADTQTCSYQHDDLIRIANVNCSPNQLVNPGFEGGNIDWSYNSGWSIVNDPANAQSGSWYLSGTSSTDTWAIATIGGSLYQPVTPGQVVQYGGWIKRISGTGNMWYSCEVVDASHNFVAWCPYGAGIGDGTGGTTWQFYQQEFTIPAGGAYVVFHTEIHGAGDPDTSSTTGYFDSASFGAPSAWTQVFSYDPFGNITKTVPSGGTGNSFQATYSTSTNHITNLPGFTPTYDGDGNVTNDSNHTYAWYADGHPSAIDGVALTYDALDRMVDQSRSGAHTQILYAPTGQKFALMAGQTLVKAFVTLSGGAQAVYTGSGLDHYRHSDWLGSARLASSTSRAVLGTVAYAPFGETYASSGTVDACYTGQNQDTTGGDFDFPAREYSTEGRWSAPDPAGMSAVDPSSPQSWNRYAYVTNTPMTLVDPLGLCDVEIDGDCGSFVPSDPPQGPVISTIIGAGPLTNLPGISGLGGRPKQPAPPPGYKDCITAALREVLASGETPNQPNGGYGTVVGGQVVSAHDPFTIFNGQHNLHLDPSWVSGHPQIYVRVHPSDPPSKWSSAFGRYQITYGTATNPNFGFTDFSPAGQDAAANTMLNYYDAVQPAMNGNFEQAIWNMWPWASMPDSPLSGNPLSWQQVTHTFQNSLMTLPECQ